MTKHEFDAKVPGTPMGKYRERLQYSILFCIIYRCVPQSECKECSLSGPRNWEGNQNRIKCFKLTVWNSANSVGSSSKGDFLSKLLRQAGTVEYFPI